MVEVATLEGAGVEEDMILLREGSFAWSAKPETKTSDLM
jgi:hypothetical protein